MYSTTQQREIQDWYGMWSKIPITRDSSKHLFRGPFKDCQGFLSRRSRPNSFIDTMRTNVYLITGTQDESISRELEDSMFANDMKELKKLEDELKMQQLQVNSKLEVMHTMDEQRLKDNIYQSTSKKLLEKVISDRTSQASLVLSALEKSYALDVKPDNNAEEDNHLNNLFTTAHLAFQGIISKHYKSPSHSRRSSLGTANQFNSLVSEVMSEKDYGQNVANWIRQEWVDHYHSCFRQRQLQAKQENSSLIHNMSFKVIQTILMWSQTHTQINAKNKTRQKLVNDALSALQNYQNSCISNPNIGYRLSDLLSIIRRVTLSAQIARCRQYVNQTTIPIESIFKNVSLDNYKSPINLAGGENIDVIIRNNFENNNTHLWVSTFSKSEQLQEILTALQKTWSTAKDKLCDMNSLANSTCEPLPNLILRVSSTCSCN